MRKPWVLTVLCVVVLVTSMTDSRPVVSEDEKPAGSNEQEIQKLLDERRDTLRSLVEVVNTHYKAGRASISDLIMSRDHLLKAEIEAATDPAERQEFRRQCVKNLEDLELIVLEQQKSGHATAKELLAAKAKRINAQIDLLRGDGD